ncbi:MAG: leucyl aminopeptidase [Acidobacteriaceae bacterium]
MHNSCVMLLIYPERHMNVKLANNLSQVDADAVVVFAAVSSAKENPTATLLSGNQAAIKATASLLGTDITGKAYEATWIYAPDGTQAKRLLVIGVGKGEKFDPNVLRNAAGAAVRQLKAKNLKSLAIALPENAAKHFSDENWVRALVIGAVVADFDANYYASDRKDQTLQVLTVINTNGSNLEAAIDEGRIIGGSQNFTRDLVNEPGNKMTPTILGERAKKMSEDVGIECEVHSTEKLKELKMGSFLSVSLGSEEPPALIVMKYEPEGAASDVTVGLVGKGITFDSGGISIKPADNMEKMKYDMAGGAAMIGAMRAIALLKLNVRVIGIVCASENMPDGKAQKPGDVRFAMNGKAIEIINTDAEGRLVLADGLCYARQLGATHLIDAATLTGACVVALGMINAGCFANDDSIYHRFHQATHHAGEKFWRLPLDEEYQDSIKSSIADIMNSGGRHAGAVTAAKFLQEFVDDKPWVHLDIAGTAWIDDNKPWITKGPSGIAVRSLVEFVRGFEKT